MSVWSDIPWRTGRTGVCADCGATYSRPYSGLLQRAWRLTRHDLAALAYAANEHDDFRDLCAKCTVTRIIGSSSMRQRNPRRWHTATTFAGRPSTWRHFLVAHYLASPARVQGELQAYLYQHATSIEYSAFIDSEYDVRCLIAALAGNDPMASIGPIPDGCTLCEGGGEISIAHGVGGLQAGSSAFEYDGWGESTWGHEGTLVRIQNGIVTREPVSPVFTIAPEQAERETVNLADDLAERMRATREAEREAEAVRADQMAAALRAATPRDWRVRAEQISDSWVQNPNCLCVDCMSIRNEDYRVEGCGCGECVWCCLREDWVTPIRNYSYKPCPHFNVSPKDSETEQFFLGVEIEAEGQQADAVARAFSLMVRPDMYLKHDSSVRGFEIVSHPRSLLSWQEHEAVLRERMDWLRGMNWRSWDAHRDGHAVGMHVHVSKNALFSPATTLVEGRNRRLGNEVSDLSSRHVYMLLQMVYGNREMMKAVVGRDTGYGSLDPETLTQGSRLGMVDVVKGLRYGSRPDVRSTAINLRPSGTIEFRMYRGSLNTDRILANIELTHALVEYTRTMTFQDYRDGVAEWPVFALWVRRNDRYPHAARLLSRMKSRQLVDAGN